jgi:group II intron reverse transcriptase/maturase
MEPAEGKMAERPSSGNISTKLDRIAELAKQMPTTPLSTLAHHIDLEWMREAYRRTRKDGTPGVDGVTADQYAQKLVENLQTLLDRAKSGTYRAPPVKRVYIPKADGKTMRPIGVPTFEDKVLQRAVVMALNAVYEQDFLDCSYGFRPRRSQHNALDTLWAGLKGIGGGWVIEVDIKSFFDSVDHALLMQTLRRRVLDGVLLRLIGKWLNAGVLEEGALHYDEEGTPQGGVISPVLANVFLHEVVDMWFEAEIKPRLRGKSFMVRYADDIAMGFEHEDDARRVMQVLPKSFGKYGLTLHPIKTRLVDFRSPKRRPPDDSGPGTFDMLGFTHYWGKSRHGDYPVVKQRTAKDRLNRVLKALASWCREHRHDAVREQQKALNKKLEGHFRYYGVTNNFDALEQVWRRTRQIWRKWLNRRSQQSSMTWPKMLRLLERLPLVRPRIYHSYQSLPRAANP